MKLPVFKLLLGSVILGIGLFCSMRYQAKVAPATLSDAIDAHIQQYKDFSGVILVAREDTVLFKKAYGYANYEFGVSNSSTTRFPIASNTKLFTAVAIMLLQKKGMLSVRDTVDAYVPGFPKTITIHHLLTHSSGIPNYYKHWDTMCACSELAAMLDAVKKWPLEFEPGLHYCYSNTGYLILAHIIEKVSGRTYGDFLQEHIFKPLDMCDTGSLSNGEIIAQKASGYQVKNAVLYNAPFVVHPLTLLGNGNLYSTVDDMHIFIQALFSGAIISQKSLKSLLSRHVLMEGSQERAHGYGCFIDTHNGKQIVEYTGALAGFLSKMVRIIDDNMTIIVLTNCENMDEFAPLCDGLLNVVQNGHF
jgi:CubicO group peptidase (beta-lactamase class C family)